RLPPRRGGSRSRTPTAPPPSGGLRRRGGGLDDQRVHAVLVVHLAAGHRRVEHAGGAHPRPRAQLVVLVPVEHVHRTRPALVGDVVVLVVELALTLDDPDGLDVVGVPEVVDRPGVEDGLVQREPDAVAGEHDALAAPVLGLDVAIGPGDLVESTDDQEDIPSVTARTDSATIASPSSSSASVMVSGGMSFMTSSVGPAVSMIRPRSNAAAHALAASSGWENDRPRARPRPFGVSSMPSEAAASSVRAASTRSPLAIVERSRASSLQNSRSAAVAVTNAGLCPRNVPLCSPGPHWSS